MSQTARATLRLNKTAHKAKIRSEGAEIGAAKRGWFGLITVKALSFVALAVLDFLIAMFVAARLVPLAMASLASGMGLNLGAASLASMAVWLLSSLALVAFIVALTLVLMRGLNLQRRALIIRAQARLDRLEARL
ncbi:MAG TPA: hypothetical protein VFU07_05245 [Candidatus Lumbricidophila sp.]|nr:hypothetical protein [Candidatus Lumbricidophila sp.]